MPEVITDNIDLWTSALLTKSTAGRGSSGRVVAYGIKKLRELILELAVRGKLVPQDPKDEPASVLLEKIVNENNGLLKKGRMKKEMPLPNISEVDKLYALPEGWEWVRLGEIGKTFIGLTYSPKDINDNGLPVLRSSNIQQSRIDLSDLVRVTCNVNPELFVEPGDLLICARNGSKSLVGKTAMIRDLQEPMVFGAFMAIYKSQCNQYVEVFLNSPLFRRNLDGVDTTTINQITQGNLKATLIPIPPLAEQHRIVAKVDELMALCDQLEQQQTNNIEAHQTLVETLLGTLTNVESQEEFAEAWTRIADHFDTLFTTEQSIDQLKQTILQLAVMGKLVPQDPDDEPAAVQLRRICRGKEVLANGGKFKKQNALSVNYEMDRLYILPDTWEWVRFGELIQSFSNGLYKKESFYSDSGVISLRMYNIQNGQVEFSDLRRVNVTDDELIQYALEPGDLLINRVNSKELVGKTAIIPEYSEPLLFESMNMRAKPYKAHLDSEYLNLFMQTGMAKSILLSTAKEAISQASINQGQIASLPVPLPPKAEQHRIVAKVNELMTLCDALKARLAAAQTTQIHLADTIVEQAVA